MVFASDHTDTARDSTHIRAIRSKCCCRVVFVRCLYYTALRKFIIYWKLSLIRAVCGLFCISFISSVVLNKKCRYIYSREDSILITKPNIGTKYLILPYNSKALGSIKKSINPIVKIPYSSLQGLISSFTTMIFLKESLILSSKAISCFRLSSSGSAKADWIEFSLYLHHCILCILRSFLGQYCHFLYVDLPITYY